MGALIQDLRYGLRMLAKNPGFTAVAVTTLALGIGANTAIFSVAEAVLLQPLPFKDPTRLVLIWGSRPEQGSPELPASFPDFTDWKARNQVFADTAAFFAYANTTFSLTGRDEPGRVQAAFVSGSFFQVLDVRPAQGRTFLAEEDQPGASRVVVLSHRLWQLRFASDPGLIGRTLTLDGNSYTVVGVMPAKFSFPRFPSDPELWIPLALDPSQGRRYSRGTRYLTVIARLKPGVTFAQAQARMETLARGLARQYPDVNTGFGVRVVPLHEQAVRDLRTALFVLVGVVGIVLLISCANVASLLLALGTRRQKEIAVRFALGASRTRLVGQLLTESLLLGLLGGTFGVLMAFWGLDLVAFIPYNTPSFFSPYTVSPDQITLNGHALGFTFLLALVTTAIFGLAPAIQTSRSSVQEALKEGSTRTAGSAHRQAFRKMVVVSEVAISLVLLSGAGLMVRSFLKLEAIDPGFAPENLFTAQIRLPRSKYADEAQVRAFSKELLDRIFGLPGIRSAGVIDQLPLSGTDESTGVFVDGQPIVAGPEMPHAHPRAVSPEYFRAMGIPLLKGRTFVESDNEGSRRVAIVNQTMARQLWPGQDSIGRRLALDYEAMKFFADRPPQLDLANGWREVVGVVGDVKSVGIQSDLPPEMYVPYAQRPSRDLGLVVRTGSDPAALALAVRQTVLSIDKDQPVSDIRNMSQLLSDSIAKPRFNSLLLSLFSGLALVLAVVGLYGFLAYLVSQRTHEIGIRVALGAKRRDVTRLVLGEGLVLTLTGVGIGLPAAFALTRLLSSLLYGVRATDPITFMAVPIVLTVVALLASYIPTRRATKVDPMVALRHE